MRRDDLQGIRGVAILLVLLFHLQPERFPLGFVGVDMFFVLSGYFMGVLLYNKSISQNLLSTFYFRRFQRIIPMYYIILLTIFISCAFFLLSSDKDSLLVDLRWAFPFLSNIQPLFETKGYWDQVNSYKFLVHCWSLGIEIQFYVIAPFLIAGTKINSNLRFIGFILLAIGSLLFQSITTEKRAYYLLPSRIWQFFFGVICTVWRKRYEKAESLKPIGQFYSSKWKGLLAEASILLIVLLTLYNPEYLTNKTARLLACSFVSLVILFPSSWSLLSSKFLTFIGDLSYSMYLIHWPMIVGVKYYYDYPSIPPKEAIYLFFSIFIVTIVFHYLIEKRVVLLTFIYGAFICVLSIFIISILEPDYRNCCNLTENMSLNLSEVIEWNQKENLLIYPDYPCDPDNVTINWYNYTFYESEMRCQSYSNGKLKVLIVGNSIAYRAFGLIHNIFKGRYKELRLFTLSSAPPLSNKNRIFSEATRIVVENFGADIIWNIHVETDKEFTQPFEKDKSDEMATTFQEHLDVFSQHARRVVIDLPYFWTETRVCYEVAKRLQFNQPLEVLKISREEAEKQQIHHKNRLLALNCTNCVYNEIEKLLFEDENYWFYNRRTLRGYTKEGIHFTKEFHKRLRPTYEKQIEKLINDLSYFL